MNEKTPLENLFDQMGELLKLINDVSAKGIDEDAVPYDIEKRMDRLEKDVEAFTRMGEKAIELSGLSPVDIRKYQEGQVKELTPEGKELIDRAKNLKDQAELLESNYLTGENKIVESKEKKVPDDPEYGKHRRKKFKRFGSDSKWKPL